LVTCLPNPRREEEKRKERLPTLPPKMFRSMKTRGPPKGENFQPHKPQLSPRELSTMEKGGSPKRGQTSLKVPIVRNPFVEIMKTERKEQNGGIWNKPTKASDAL